MNMNHVTGLLFFITIMTQLNKACKKVVFFLVGYTGQEKHKTQLGMAHNIKVKWQLPWIRDSKENLRRSLKRKRHEVDQSC